MLSFEEWFNYGSSIGFIKLNPDPDLCDIGFETEYPENIQSVDIYNNKYDEISDIHKWSSPRLDNFKVGCIKHDLKPPFVYLDYEGNAKRLNKDVMLTESTEEPILELINFAQSINPCDSFVDIGCGPGLPMLLASKSGYEYIEGIEVVPEIYEKAKINLSETKAEVLCLDAKEYTLKNKKQHIFFYNTFGNDVLTEFLERNIEIIKQTDSLVLFQNCFRADHVLRLFGMKPHLSLDIDTQIYSF